MVDHKKADDRKDDDSDKNDGFFSKMLKSLPSMKDLKKVIDKGDDKKADGNDGNTDPFSKTLKSSSSITGDKKPSDKELDFRDKTSVLVAQVVKSTPKWFAPLGVAAEKIFEFLCDVYINRSQRPMLLGLQHAGNIVVEIDVNEIKDELTIGNATDNDFVTPPEDKTCNPHHARITRDGNKLYIEDLGSKNGVYLNSERISQKRWFRRGDFISIGECVLSLEENLHATSDKCVHKLKILNTALAGEVIDLENKDTFLLGSSKDCDLRVPEQLVSPRHTQIALKKDGGCWIKDLHGKNGTTVNRSKLTPGKERLLQDRDLIGMAHVDLRFLDGNSRIEYGRLGFQVFVIAVTLLVSIGAFVIYRSVSPSAASYLTLAAESAGKGDFDSAKSYLNSAENARGASSISVQHSALNRDIHSWESMIQQWDDARAMLKNGDFVGAARLLGLLGNADMRLWAWDEKNAYHNKKLAETSKNLIDAYFQCLTFSKTSSSTIDQMRKSAENLKTALNVKNKPEFLLPLISVSRKLLVKVDEELASYNTLYAYLKTLDSEKPNYKKLIEELEQLEKASDGSIDRKILELLVPIRGLSIANDMLERKKSLVAEMRFEEVKKLQPIFPSSLACAVYPPLANLRRQLEKRDQEVDRVSTRLAFYQKRLSNLGFDGNAVPDCMRMVMDEQCLKKVFNCDSLKGDLPKRTRKTPQGKYDEILGIEFFYTFLINLPGVYDPAYVEDAPFVPAIARYLELMDGVKNFSSYVNRKDVAPFVSGRLKEYAATAERLVERRDDFVEELVSISEGKMSRKGVIAAGMAAFLTPEDERRDEIAKHAAELFLEFRKPFIKLNQEYTNSPPKQAMKIREKILAGGLPGDTIVVRMWATKDDASKTGSPPK